MTTGSQQLADDYGQLKELLELYPLITILRVEGDPPDHYELAYHLRGYVRTDDGAVGIGTDHQVRISLPFGYPHFAPIAKPLTPDAIASVLDRLLPPHPTPPSSSNPAATIR